MNRSSSIRTNSIAQNCRSILRERCFQRTCNYTCTFPQQGCPPNAWKPCCAIPTNPICSPYGVDNLRVPIMCCEQPSCSIPIPSNSCFCQSTPSENCIGMITNAIMNKIRYKIPEEEISRLCCCLPSLIRQIMCKSPWLLPSDIIQWLSTDIIKEAMNGFDRDNSKQMGPGRENFVQTEENNKYDDNLSSKSHENDNDSLSSYRSNTSAISQESMFQSPRKHNKKNFKKNERKEKIKNRTPSTHSFDSRQNNDQESDRENKHNRSTEDDRDGREAVGDPEIFLIDSDLSMDTYESNGSNPDNRSPRDGRRIEYPGKKDPNARKDVEKCQAFYDKIREYFDDDTAAMLFKCCLCYGDCSGRR